MPYKGPVLRSYVTMLFLSIGLLLAFPPSLPAAEQVGTFSKVEGVVDVMRNGALPAIPVQVGSPVMVKDFIRTKSNARAEVAFKDGSILKIAPRTRVDINEYLTGTSGNARKLELPRGKVEAVVKKNVSGGQPQRFEIRTPNAVAGVRGTDFFVFHDRNTTGVLVKEGSVFTFNPRFPDNVVTVPAGTATSVSARMPPVAPRPASANELKLHQGDVSVTEKSGGKEGGAKQPAPGKVETGAQPSGMLAGITAAMPTVASVTDSQSLAVQQALAPTTQTQTSPLTPPPVTETVVSGSTLAKLATPPLFASAFNAVPMSRDTTFTNGLLTIIADAPFSGLLEGIEPLWSNTLTPFTIAGSYPQVTGSNHYWMGGVVSHNSLNGTDTTYDDGTYFGFMGGITLDPTLALEGHLAALYVDPTGKAGILKGTFAGTVNGGWTAKGALSRIELDAKGTGLVPSLLPLGWWDPKVTPDYLITLAPPAVMQQPPNAVDGKDNADGFMVGANLDISGKMSDRGDVLKFAFLKTAPWFGIWQRESFGRFTSTDTNFVLATNADLGFMDTTTNRWVSDSIIQVVSFGQWQPGGKLDGVAYGYWGDWKAGSVRLLTGEVVGAANTSPGTFGALSTGSWLDVPTFLSSPSLAQQLGFPTVQRPSTFTLTGSNAQGSAVTIPNLTFYSYTATDPIALWVAKGVSGSYVGALDNQTFSLLEAGGTVRGDLRLRHAGASPLSGTNTWLGEISAMGELGGPFRSSIDGVAVGTYDQTTSTFNGVAVGTSHPLGHLSLIDGTTTTLRHYVTGGYQTGGGLTGLMGGMSFWKASPANPAELVFRGVHSPASVTYNDYTFSANVGSFDVPSGTNTTADGGAYRGFLAGAYSRIAQYPARTVDGLVSLLYLDPTGRGGIVTGKFDGHLDMQGFWDGRGDIFPVEMTASVGGGVTAGNLTGSILSSAVPASSVSPGNFPGSGGSITPGVTGGDSWVTQRISGISDWGVSLITWSGTYSNAASDQQWTLPVNFPGTTRFLDGATIGDGWSAATNKLHGMTYAWWSDMAPAVPATGIYAGETIGTFDPVALTWQSVTSGAWLETAKFLQMAATPAGHTALQQLNIPSFEIGSTNFSGASPAGTDSLAVAINNVKFFAPTNGGRPVLWASGSVTGSYTGNPALVSPIALTESGGVNASGLNPNLTVQQWSGGKWGAQVQAPSPSGTVGTHTGISLSGMAAGTYGAGSLSGTAAGTVK